MTITVYEEIPLSFNKIERRQNYDTFLKIRKYLREEFYTMHASKVVSNVNSKTGSTFRCFDLQLNQQNAYMRVLWKNLFYLSSISLLLHARLRIAPNNFPGTSNCIPTCPYSHATLRAPATRGRRNRHEITPTWRYYALIYVRSNE